MTFVDFRMRPSDTEALKDHLEVPERVFSTSFPSEKEYIFSVFLKEFTVEDNCR